MNVSTTFVVDMSKFFVCQNGENISWTSVCDGYNQCIDGSDERNCYCQGDVYACLQGNNVSCRVACATYGRVTCLTYQNRRACERYIRKYNSLTHFNINSTHQSSILTSDFDALRYSTYLAIGILLLVLIFSILIYLIRKNPFQLLSSCANKPLTTHLHRKSTNRLSSILQQQQQQQQSSSLNLSHSRYTPAPNINDLPPSYYYSDQNSTPIDEYYESTHYPASSLFSSDSIYYETIKTPSISNSMSMLHPLPLPEPSQRISNIRTYCV